ncbi:MAG: CHAT domain-containing protein, partial [Bacteroidota bacterium]
LKSAADCYELAIKTMRQQKAIYGSESAKYYIGDYSHIYIERAIDIYYQLYQLKGKEKYLERIFALMEVSKASVLKEALQKNKAILLSNIPDSLLRQEKDQRLRIAELQKKISLKQLNLSEQDSLYVKDSVYIEQLTVEMGNEQENYQQFLQDLKIAYPEFASTNEKVPAPTIQAIKNRLSDFDGILLEYFTGQSSIYLLAIDAKGGQLVKIDRSDQLNEAINQLLTYFQSAAAIGQAPDQYLANAQQLFYQLFPPGWEVNADNRQLILIPDGILKYIPFEALVVGEVGQNYTLSNAPYLLKDHTITYAYSAALFLFEEVNEEGKMLLKVAPGFLEGERGQVPLAHSQLEFSLPGVHELLGAKANLQNFKQYAGNSKVIHLSTHAAANPLTNSAQIELVDTAMYLPEIYGMNLKTDLVVLSACESGMGKMEKGEGVISLGRAFRYAGASSIISSLWKVNEASTATIFTNFYDQLKLGTPKASALRQAKLNYLEQAGSDLKKSPFYWSSFVYFGSNDALDLRTSPAYYPWIWMPIVLLVLFLMSRILLRRRQATQ